MDMINSQKRPQIEFTTEYKADKDEWYQMCHSFFNKSTN